MNTDFKNGKELLEFCEKEKISISRAMLLRESDQTEKTESSIYTRMETAWNIMKEAALSPISSPGKSIGGLIGGEAKQLNQLFKAEKNICGTAVSRGITYAMAVLEVNASMGLIVAAPTAGSSGIVPGVVLSLKEEHDFSDSRSNRISGHAQCHCSRRSRRLSGRSRRCFCHGCFCRRRTYGRLTSPVSLCCKHSSYEYAGTGL